MATYISLINWTEQGAREFKDTVKRSEQANQLIERLGGRVLQTYWTVGPYDLVAITEFADEEAASAAALTIGAQGNLRTTTLRAFDTAEMRRILDMAP
ncbi:MAG: GYD domain-containing protein [Actinomycetota bacterium]|nr:GYD domain-containing protein [Actinomycetota bacterium]